MDYNALKTEQELKNLPPVLSDKVEELQRSVAEVEKDLKSKDITEWCPEKYAHVSFTFEGKQYVIYPKAFNIDDTLFYYARESIINTLKIAGAEDIKYVGMID